jgi:2-oxoglutarate dehydrogenase E2 component (dihydrolipoamide succinyltransferase)
MISIKVPPLGESIVEATIARWTKKEGDAVASGETLVELETDKITVEVPALRAGVLAKRLRAEGDVVKVDEMLGEIDDSAVPAATSAGDVVEPGESTTTSTPEAPAARRDSVGVPDAAPGATRASPAAHRAAAESGVELGSVPGSGRAGMVTKQDVLAQPGAKPRDQAVEQPTSAAPRSEQPGTAPSAPKRQSPRTPPAGERETREKMTTRRKRIAENLLQAQHSTAHLTTFNEIDMSAVEALRSRVKERIEKEHGLRLSVMPFFVKAAVLALESFPVVNAQIDGDSIVYKHYVNMGVAVASEAGLVVPNIKDADRKGIVEIGQEIVSVAKRAREGKLAMDDLTGGTFTITNGGVFGSLVSTPIINYPQVAILGLHKTQDRPVVAGGQVVVRPMMYVALSYDHRIIDGQQAVLFLVRIKELMEDPALMALG